VTNGNGSIASAPSKKIRADRTEDEPYDMTAEIGVIGSILLAAQDPAFRSIIDQVFSRLQPPHFFDPVHQTIYRHIVDLQRTSRLDPILLVASLKASGELRAIGGKAYISKLGIEVPTVSNAVYYADLVLKLAERRRYIELATEILRHGRNGSELDEVAQLIDRFRETRSDTSDEIAYRVVKGTELATATHEIEYIVDGIYAANQPMIIGGGKKNLKTNSLLDLGVSMTTGSSFLGKFAVNRRVRVLIMTGESGEATVAETCQRIARAKQVDLNDDLIISHDLPRVEEPLHQQALKKLLRAERPEVIILDPAYLVMSGDDAASLFKTGGVLRAVTELCKSEGASLILAHHTKKKSNGNRGSFESFSPPELEDLSWAGFQEFARQWLLYSRRAPYDPENAGHHEMWLSAGGSAGHSSLWSVTVDEGLRSDPGGRRWDVEVNSPTVARQSSQRDAIERREAYKNTQHQKRVEAACGAIEEAVISLPNNEGSQSQIASRAGKRGVAFNEAWGNLLRRGKLVECTITKSNGHEYPGFRWVFDRNDA
jgi:hypothetical protein